MFIGIALVNDIKVQNIARKISYEGAKYYGIDNESIYMVPHISLKQSFPYSDDISKLEVYFDRFFAQIEPFSITIDRVNMIETNEITGILWFDIVESTTLRELHHALCDGLWDEFGIQPVGFDGIEWHFHSTIIYSKTGIKDLEALFVKYKDCYQGIDFIAQEAIMFCQLKDETTLKEIFTYKLFPLGKLIETV